MLRLLKTTLLIAALAPASNSGQCPDGYDTLYTRSEAYVVMPKFDTVKQLKKANQTASQILSDLEEIKIKLNIKDTLP